MKPITFNLIVRQFFYCLISIVIISCDAGNIGDTDIIGDTDNNVGVNINGPLRSISLTWTPPTTNNDGSTLADLDGYKIYYGPSNDSLNEVITIDNEGVADYQTDELQIDLNLTDTYFFAITAFNTLGLEGPLSNTVSKQFTN